MAGKRKNYSAEFKAKVALEAIRGDATVAELVAKHGAHQTVINTWSEGPPATGPRARPEPRRSRG